MSIQIRQLPASAVVPTRNRVGAMGRMLDSLLKQDALPAELIVVDGSEDDETQRVVETFAQSTAGICTVKYLRAETLGAAVQRNQGVAVAMQPVIWFFDDDILFEPDCVTRLWAAFKSADDIGGANAMITNQRYQPPGRVSRIMFRLMGGRGSSFAGRVLGPAVNLLPEDRDDLPEIVPVEWINLGCTLYRREALPEPAFSTHFTGYSLMEDVTLSVIVGRKWKLVNARTARIFHDSQPGSHKADVCDMAAMELINRHYVMTCILRRRSLKDYLRLGLWEAFQLVVCAARRDSRHELVRACRGKLRAVFEICRAEPNPLTINP
ncbi:MAG: glycosyltransferase family 2 protein [Prosthecobacter sp.]|uniref:glycosyltransferase family 2 protein n=1 Tax=Prosthecobacter sp. TaxID=1965333 RepID=UPI0038FEE57D